MIERSEQIRASLEEQNNTNEKKTHCLSFE